MPDADGWIEDRPVVDLESFREMVRSGTITLETECWLDRGGHQCCYYGFRALPLSQVYLIGGRGAFYEQVIASNIKVSETVGRLLEITEGIN